MLPADRAHYDRVMTWATSVLGRMTPEQLAEVQAECTLRARTAASGDDDDDKVFAVLTELGFAAVLDNMLQTINDHEASKDAAS